MSHLVTRTPRHVKRPPLGEQPLEWSAWTRALGVCLPPRPAPDPNARRPYLPRVNRALAREIAERERMLEVVTE